ncbi:MAG: 23S rRNA (pseudouridine(1915)-N(3))-methyltransferase RlmH [Pseudohongiellaceae bacterium]
MKITLLAVGSRMNDWVIAGVDEYSKRLRGVVEFTLVEVPLARRGKSANIDQLVQKEGRVLLDKIPAGDFVVALEVGGRILDTDGFASRLENIRDSSRDLSLLVGGPEGLADACRQRADEAWSLSALTLPHPLVRIIVAEQVYRAFSLLQGHPYHRK